MKLLKVNDDISCKKSARYDFNVQATKNVFKTHFSVEMTAV